MSVVAETLDLSRLPAPNLLALAYESDLAVRIERLKERYTAAGIEFDVEKLLTSPAVILQENDNERETLAKAAINDLYKQTLVAFSTGADLDHVGATLHFLPRQQGELDARYRYRLQLESENKSGGRLSGYMAEALKSSDVFAVGAWVDRTVVYEPTVRVALQVAAANGAAPSELVALVQAHIDREDVRQATDVVVVQSVAVTNYAINVRLFHRSGPDPVVLRTNAKTALEKMVAERWQPGRDVPLAAITAAAMVAGAERIEILSPPADVVIGNGGLATCTGVSVASETTSG